MARSTGTRQHGPSINDTVEKVAGGVTEVGRAGSTIDDVVSSVQSVSAFIAEVATGLSSQEAGISQIDQAMRDLDVNTQQNAAIAEESASAAESVRGQSSALVKAVDQFKLSAAA